MIKTEDLIAEALSLPVEVRIKLAERLLNSINPSRKEIDEAWAVEAEKRVREIREGKVKTIQGDEVFKKIGNRLSK